MSDLMPLLPRQKAPPLFVPTATGGTFDLAQEVPRLMSMLVFYRGLHCMQCRDYIRELDNALPELEKRGILSIAISSDDATRGRQAALEWGLGRVRIGYGLTPRVARNWGLFLSKGRSRPKGIQEPPWYCEPALYLISADKTVFFSSVQNMPFARPRFADIIAGFEFMFERGYFLTKECPARGEIQEIAEITGDH